MSSSSTGAEPARDRVTAVVVNWNTRDLLDTCLRSLREHWAGDRQREVVVVDNGSDDGSRELLAERWPDARALVNDHNLGFTGAANQGIRAATGEHVLLINTDAELLPGCLDAMLARLEADPRAAVIGPRLVYGDGSWQRWTAGRAPTVASVAAHLLGLDRVTAAGARASVYLARDVDRPFRPDWVSSACMLVRRAALDQAGLLDERYTCYMDDVELCRRVREAGWHVWYEPRAEARHLMGQTSARRGTAASPAALRTFNHYFARHHGARGAAALRALEVVGFGLRAVVAGVAGLAPGARLPRARAAAHLRHLRVSLERGSHRIVAAPVPKEDPP